MIPHLPPILLLSALLFAHANAERISLDGEWAFQTDPYKLGLENHWDKGAELNDTMTVPGNWDTHNEYADYVGQAWYQREFEAPESWSDKRVQLHFDGVYNDSTVWLNGERLGSNNIGFLAFHFEISKAVRPGETNTLVVLVDNTFKRGAMWNWGGIRRSVWLDVGAVERIDGQWITALPDLETGSAEVSVQVDMSQTGADNGPLTARVRLTGHGLSVEREQEVDWSGQPTASVKLAFALDPEDVRLWHYNTPHLYTSTVEILREGIVVDRHEDRFGIRRIEIDGTEVKLNGEALRMVGFNLVPEDRTTGNTLPLWRIQEDVDLMKSLGAYFSRLSHQPLPKTFLDYLDARGIMTFEEVPLWGRDVLVDPDHPTPKEWLNRMIRERYNHPSVIGWCVGNEIGSPRRNPKVFEYVKGAIEQAKALDPHRLAVYASNSAQYQPVDAIEFADMILLNAYGGWGKNAERAFEYHGPKPLFMSEMGDALAHEDPNLGTIDVARMLNQLRGHDYLMGASLWAFSDYRSKWHSDDPTWKTPPSQNRPWGVVNAFRQPKRAFYTIADQYAPLKDLEISLVGEGNLVFKLTTRAPLDLPSYPMEDYSLVWFAFGAEDKLLDQSWHALPQLEPDSSEHSIQARIRKNLDAAERIEVSLIDPQGYSMMHRQLFLKEPQLPQIIGTFVGPKEFRVVFEPDENATEHWLEYQLEGELIRTKPTINNFIDIRDLELDEEYAMTIVASNEKGTKRAPEPMGFRTVSDEVPPIVWSTQAGDRCAFIGYSVRPRDFGYEVRYGTQPGIYDKILTFKNQGAARIPNLKNGQTYHMQIRRLMQWGFASEWSPAFEVTPVEPEREDVPVMTQAVFQKGRDALIHIEPLPQAIAYTVTWTGSGGTRESKKIPGTRRDFLLLKDVGNIGDVTVTAAF